MSDPGDYKKAYDRQKLAREKAESLLEVRSRELYDANQTLSRAYNKLRDQKAQLVQQEKLASIGLLAAGVAHEINNPIGYIRSNLQTLQEYFDSITTSLDAYRALADKLDDSEHKLAFEEELQRIEALIETQDLDFISRDSIVCIEESLAGSKRVEDIVINLRDFARTDNEKRELCNLNDLVEHSLKLVHIELKYHCEVIREFEDVPQVYACVGQLNQVLINIIMNAVQAMSGKGKLLIRTHGDDKQVLVEFIDNGPGIDDDMLLKLFDPFFTTKEVGSGTGLGLYVSHGLVKKHGGEIRAANVADGGACFTIALPVQMRDRSNKYP